MIAKNVCKIFTKLLCKKLESSQKFVELLYHKAIWKRKILLLNNFFTNKVKILRSDMNFTDSDCCKLVDKIMYGKNCHFNFITATQEAVEKMVQCLSAIQLSKSVCHISNRSVLSCTFPELWKLSKLNFYSKTQKQVLLETNQFTLIVKQDFGEGRFESNNGLF